MREKVRDQVRGWIHRMIDEFEDEIGHAGGPSYSVIEDYNLTNSCIRGDIAFIDTLIREGNTDNGYSVGELYCIKGFLRALLQIPERERAEQAWGYYDWDDADASPDDYMEDE